MLNEWQLKEVAAGPYTRERTLSLISDVKMLRTILQQLADACDDVGVKHFDTDTMSDEVQRMQNTTHIARRALSKNPERWGKNVPIVGSGA